jgi:hypothetical protein
MVGLALSKDPHSYWQGLPCVSNDSDNKEYPGPPGWGLGVGLTTPSHKKCFLEKLLKFETGQQFWKRLKSTKDCNATRIIIIMKLMYCHVGVHC